MIKEYLRTEDVFEEKKKLVEYFRAIIFEVETLSESEKVALLSDIDSCLCMLYYCTTSFGLVSKRKISKAKTKASRILAGIINTHKLNLVYKEKFQAKLDEIRMSDEELAEDISDNIATYVNKSFRNSHSIVQEQHISRKIEPRIDEIIVRKLNKKIKEGK